MGQHLFQRDNNRYIQIDNARKRAEAVALGLGHVDQVWQGISASPKRNEVVLVCTFGLAGHWLLLRFSGLQTAMTARVCGS